MLYLYWIVFSLAGISLAVIIGIFVRHWKEIRLLDPDSIKEEQMRKRKEALILQRFQRITATRITPVRLMFQKMMVAGKQAFHGAYIRLVKLNRVYRQAKAPFAHVAPSIQDRVKTLMEEARSLARDLKWPEAERRYLEVLGIDNHHVEAYKGLGTIYLKQKLYPQAKETFEFLVGSRKADDACYAALAEIAEAENDLPRAEKFYLMALELNPRSAARSADVAQFYLDHDEPAKAWDPVLAAVEREPKSAKYLEMVIEAAIRLGQWEEARRRYDAFRLVCQDRVKLNILKERIENRSF